MGSVSQGLKVPTWSHDPQREELLGPKQPALRGHEEWHEADPVVVSIIIGKNCEQKDLLFLQ